MKAELWARQQNESEKAFEAFAIYRDLGLSRTVTEVVKRLSKSRHLIARWKSLYNWDERALAYDNELEKQGMKEAAKRVREMTRRHIDLALRLQNKAIEALEALSPDDMQAKDVLAFLKESTGLERMNRIEEAGSEYKSKDESGSVSLAEVIMQAYKHRHDID